MAIPSTPLPCAGESSALMTLLEDQQMRWRRGERVPVEAYLARQAHLHGDREALLELILHEVLLRQERGETPVLAEYQQRFPHLSEHLLIQFEVERAIEGASLSLLARLQAEPDGRTSGSRRRGPAVAPLPSEMTSVEQARFLDRICTRFEQAWRNGRPRIEDYLPAGAPADVMAVLRELIHLDVEYRRRAGEDPCAADYRTRFATLDSAWLAEALGRPARRKGAGPGELPAIPGYEVLGELGRGGMGVVYKARHLRLNRMVALKMVLSGPQAIPEERLRFLAEAEAIAAVRHPGIVQVHDFGTHDGLPFFSMEFCAGGSLAGKLAGGPLPVRQAATLVEQVARAVQAAHEQGIVHRDLKPANVLLDEHGRPRVTDFGLAKRCEVGAGLTQTGAVLGTPSYMAPEQAQGKKSTCFAADVYALGAILYECLTGRPPFKAATTYETLVQVVNDEPVPPRQLSSAVPPDLETICLKCLRKEPPRRYASAGSVADDLIRFLQDEPVRARPVGTGERFWRSCRRNPAVAGLLAAVAAMLVLGTVVATYFALRAEANADQARKLAGRESNRAQAEKEARQAADRERRRAETEKAEKERQLELTRTTLVTAQLLRVAAVWKRDPGLGRQLLHDQQVIPLDRRDFAWSYYRRLCQRAPLLLRADGQGALCVAFSPDGKTLASGTLGQTIQLWDARSGKKGLVLRGHTGGVAAVAFSPDGKELASASSDQTVALWDVATGKRRAVLKGHTDGILSVAFSPDGQSLGSAGWDRTIRLWSAATGQPLGVLNGHGAGVSAVAFAPDGKSLASASLDKTVRVWDLATRRQRAALAGHTGWIWSVAFSPDGKALASGSLDETVRLWELGTGRERAVLRGHSDVVRSVAFSPNGKLLGSGSADGTVRLWDAVTGQEHTILQGHTDRVWSIAFSPSSRSVASASWDQSVRVWDAVVRPGRTLLAGHTGEVGAVAFRPDGLMLASAGADKSVRLWDAVSAQQRAVLTGHRAGVRAATFSPDGGCLASASWDHTVGLWDAATGRERAVLRGHTDAVCSLAFSPDSQLLASAGWDKTIRLWDPVRKKTRAILPGHTDWVCSVAFSPDGKLLASASWDNTVRLWDASTGQQRAVLKGHRDGVLSVVFSPDGKLLASASNDQTIKLWNLPGGQERAVLKGHTGGILCLAFSPHCLSLASGSWDQTIRLWNVVTGQERAVLKGHTAAVTAIAFRRDGTSLASASNDQTIVLWHTGAREDLPQASRLPETE